MKIGIKDVFDCLEISFDLKKVAFTLGGLLVGMIGMFALLWIGGIPNNVPVFLICQLAGLLFALVCYVLVMGAVSIMGYKELTSGEKVSVWQALGTAKDNIWSFLLSPLAVALAVVLILAMEYVVFMLGRLAAGQIILSLLSIPFVLLNILLILALVIGYILVFAIVASEGSGVLSTVNRIYTAIKKAPLQIAMGVALVVVVGTPVVLVGYGALLGGVVATLAIFGAASGIFADMAASEIPSLSSSTQAAWSIFGFFVSLLAGMLGAFILVYIKTSAVSIYLNIKDRL